MNKIFIGLSLCLLVAFAACSGEQTEKPSTQKQATPQSQTTGNNELTAWQLEHGIGPITEPVKLGPIDEKLVQMGEAVFNSKCAASIN